MPEEIRLFNGPTDTKTVLKGIIGGGYGDKRANPVDFRKSVLDHKGHPLTRDQYLQRVGESLNRNLPTLRHLDNRAQHWAVLGSGPSLKDSLEQILLLKKGGANIITVNKSHDWALDNGIVPWAHVMLDSNEWVADYVKRPRHDVRYLIASQCHEKTFEAFKGKQVYLWHGGQDYPEGSVPFEYLQSYWPRRFPNECVVAGGTTVGLRVPMLAPFIGPVTPIKFHMFGLDSSSMEPAKMHAMDKKLRDDLGPGDIIYQYNHQWWYFHTNAHMVRQVVDFEMMIEEFPEKYRKGLYPKGFELLIYGSGLLPFLAAAKYRLHAYEAYNTNPEEVGGYFKSDIMKNKDVGLKAEPLSMDMAALAAIKLDIENKVYGSAVNP